MTTTHAKVAKIMDSRLLKQEKQRYAVSSLLVNGPGSVYGYPLKSLEPGVGRAVAMPTSGRFLTKEIDDATF